MTERIVFLDNATIGPGVTIRPPSFAHDWQQFDRTEPAQIVERLSGATVAITNKVPLRADTLARLPALKLIAVAATGYDVIDLDSCRRQGITVSNIRNYAVNTVPEHTFSLILALRRNLIEYREQVIDGEWVRSNQFCFFNRPIPDLAGSTLGVIGAGSIGQSVGRIGAAFGMRVIYHDAYAKQPPAHGKLVTLDEVCTSADVLTCHCPLTDETRNLIDAKFLARMRRTAVVINTARGGLIDEDALADALKAGRIAGAGIDVVSREPAPMDSAMMKVATMPNVILTPHVAWASTGAMQTLVDQLIDNVEAFVAGSPRNVVG